MFQTGSAELFAMPELNLVARNVGTVHAEIMNGIDSSPQEWELLVIDLTNVYSIDVRGIQLIIEFYRLTGESNRKFMLINVSENILRFLQLFRLHTKFPIGLNKTSAQLQAEKEAN
ncbi:MAG: STAS domain-containing protein [Lentisphaeraceae bacterium]|nr:STAS domain-containing protein [Lentisphaeraceae bacterium]